VGVAVSTPTETGTRVKRVRFTFKNKLGRALWTLVWMMFFRTSPRFMFFWRRFLLRCFGARMAAGTIVYPSTRIWAPWHLEMEVESCLSFGVECYSVDRIRLGHRAVVSQYAFLCGASHDYNDPAMPTIAGPIILGDFAWVCAGAFVGPGVTLGDGVVAGARAVVLRDVAAWNIVAGNPAIVVKTRDSSPFKRS